MLCLTLQTGCADAAPAAKGKSDKHSKECTVANALQSNSLILASAMNPSIFSYSSALISLLRMIYTPLVVCRIGHERSIIIENSTPTSNPKEEGFAIVA